MPSPLMELVLEEMKGLRRDMQNLSRDMNSRLSLLEAQNAKRQGVFHLLGRLSTGLGALLLVVASGLLTWLAGRGG